MGLNEEESAPLMVRDRGGSQRSSSSNGPSLQVHLYFFPATKDTTTIHLSCGQVSADNVCIQAGKKCGKIAIVITFINNDFSLETLSAVCKINCITVVYLILRLVSKRLAARNVFGSFHFIRRLFPHGH